MHESFIFILMVALALGISKTPLRYPFKWLETFFHELSHGLAAIVTFGWIHRVTLNFNGAGSCTTKGGWRFLILISGYLGAVFWGALIYLAGWSLDEVGSVELLYFLNGLIVITTVLWVRSLSTFIILAVMFVVFWLPSQVPNWAWIPYFIKFMGMYVLLSAVKAPLALIDGKHVGDGAALQDLTFVIPEGVWIVLWFVAGLATLGGLWALQVGLLNAWLQ